MNKWLKRGGIALLGLVATAAAALVVGAQLGERKMQRRVEVRLDAVPYRSDAATIERGKYLYVSRNCAECHGADGAGKDVVNDGKGLLVHAPNITPAPGAAVAAYTALDWVRTIRHGVKPDGRPAIVMPSEDYARLTDDDLAAVVAYVRQLPPAPGPGATIAFPLPVKALYAAGLVKDAAERIDHTLPPALPVPEGVTVAHGAYVANTCIGCHGEHLSGGKIPGAPPDWPAAANLTPGEGSALARYPDADAMIAMFRSGKRPDGSAVSPVMPFAGLQAMNDTDVRALYLHLKSVPPRASGQR
ncbi:c-type cytochrome [Rhizobacter fulvus]|jgi:mono/diheme cytochrome c family protein